MVGGVGCGLCSNATLAMAMTSSAKKTGLCLFALGLLAGCSRQAPVVDAAPTVLVWRELHGIRATATTRSPNV